MTTVVLIIDELGAIIISPSSLLSLLYNNPISNTIPVLLKTVTLSPILNGLVMARYSPAIIFPKIF